jgi:hypothetical protein
MTGSKFIFLYDIKNINPAAIKPQNNKTLYFILFSTSIKIKG